MKNITEILQDYRKLSEEIDKKFQELQSYWGNEINCKKGCTKCCITLNLFPVEIYCLKKLMEEDNFKINTEDISKKEKCLFLKDKKCLIYKYRPFICRSQGLPLLILNNAPYNPQYEIGFCDLNFTNHENLEFKEKNVLDLEIWNHKLQELNKSFLKFSQGNNYTSAESSKYENSN